MYYWHYEMCNFFDVAITPKRVVLTLLGMYVTYKAFGFVVSQVYSFLESREEKRFLKRKSERMVKYHELNRIFHYDKIYPSTNVHVNFDTSKFYSDLMPIYPNLLVDDVTRVIPLKGSDILISVPMDLRSVHSSPSVSSSLPFPIPTVRNSHLFPSILEGVSSSLPSIPEEIEVE